MDLSFWKILQTGGVALYVSLAMSVLAVAVAIERIVILW